MLARLGSGVLQEKHRSNEVMAHMLKASLDVLTKAQVALQAERAAFAAEKEQWRTRVQAAERVQLMARQPIEEFVVNPHRHSFQVHPVGGLVRLQPPSHCNLCRRLSVCTHACS